MSVGIGHNSGVPEMRGEIDVPWKEPDSAGEQAPAAAAVPEVPPGPDADTVRAALIALAHHDRDIAAIAADLNVAKGERRAYLKKCKKNGLSTDALIDARRTADLGEAEAQRITTERARYLQLTGVQVYQSLAALLGLPDGDDAGDPVFAANQAGFVAGRSGLQAEVNPHHAGEELHQAWAKGQRSGLELWQRTHGTSARQASPARERPTSRGTARATTGKPKQIPMFRKSRRGRNK